MSERGQRFVLSALSVMVVIQLMRVLAKLWSLSN